MFRRGSWVKVGGLRGRGGAALVALALLGQVAASGSAGAVASDPVEPSGIDPISTPQTRLSQSDLAVDSGVVAVSGKKFAYSTRTQYDSVGPNSIVVVDLDSLERSTIEMGTQYLDVSAISDDGSYLAYTRRQTEPEGDPVLVMLNLDTDVETVINVAGSEFVYGGSVSLSADGSRMLFGTSGPDGYGAVVWNAAQPDQAAGVAVPAGMSLELQTLQMAPDGLTALGVMSSPAGQALWSFQMNGEPPSQVSSVRRSMQRFATSDDFRYVLVQSTIASSGWQDGPLTLIDRDADGDGVLDGGGPAAGDPDGFWTNESQVGEGRTRFAEIDELSISGDGSTLGYLTTGPHGYCDNPGGSPDPVVAVVWDRVSGVTWEREIEKPGYWTCYFERIFRLSATGSRAVVSTFSPLEETDGQTSEDDLDAYLINIDSSTDGGTLPDNGDPQFDNWHPGDVHAHAAGDNWIENSQGACGARTGQVCANYLVDNVLKRAKRFDTEWVIFTEHVPWLGFDPEVESFYDKVQAENNWQMLGQAMNSLSDNEIRGLLGQELGTAAPACTTRKRPSRRPGPPGLGDFVASPGHYGVYYTPELTDQASFDCNEFGYVRKVGSVGGWGGVNHPDQWDGGSQWHCWTTELGPDLETVKDWLLFPLTHEPGQLAERGAQMQPGNGFPNRCDSGIDKLAATSTDDSSAFRSMEIINGSDIPSNKTLGIWDMYLQNGFRISAVGGGDGHIGGRNQPGTGGDEPPPNEIYAAICLPLSPFYDRRSCVDLMAQPTKFNHNKVGGTGRTLAFYEDGPSMATFDTLAEGDPARTAISEGRTVATNGPKFAAQIGGQFPGSTVTLRTSEPVPVRVDWGQSWKSIGDTIGKDEGNSDDRSIFPPHEEVTDLDTIPGDGEKMEQFPAPGEGLPEFVVVTSAPTDSCGDNRFKCAQDMERRVISLKDVDPAGGVQVIGEGVRVNPEERWLEAPVQPVEGRSYVRTEAYWDVEGIEADSEAGDTADSLYAQVSGNGRNRYPFNNRRMDFAAFTSPIFLDNQSSERSSVDVVVLDDDGRVLEGALVSVCATVGLQCETDVMTDPGPTRIEGLLPERTYKVRAFPPANSTLDPGEVLVITPQAPGNEQVALQLEDLPGDPYIDPSGLVVDTKGQPIAGARVGLFTGLVPDGEFLPIPDGDARMSPANRTSVVDSDGEGAFRWDVMPGWWRVYAYKDGCQAAPDSPVADSGVLQVPEPVTDLRLVLDCEPESGDPPVVNIGDGTDTSYSNESEFDVSFDVTGGAGDVLVQCKLDGTDLHGGAGPEIETCESPVALSGLDEGSHNLTVSALDSQINVGTAEVTIIVDSTPPELSFDGPEDGHTYETVAPEPSCSASDDGSGLIAACAGDVTGPEGGIGQFTYTATAVDKAGNETTKTISRGRPPARIQPYPMAREIRHLTRTRHRPQQAPDNPMDLMPHDRTRITGLAPRPGKVSS